MLFFVPVVLTSDSSASGRTLLLEIPTKRRTESEEAGKSARGASDSLLSRTLGRRTRRPAEDPDDAGEGVCGAGTSSRGSTATSESLSWTVPGRRRTRRLASPPVRRCLAEGCPRRWTASPHRSNSGDARSASKPLLMRRRSRRRWAAALQGPG